MKYNLISERNEDLTPVEQILKNRGVAVSEIPSLLRTNDTMLLPFGLLDNIKDGIQLLFSHLRNGDKILIQVDSDVDGYTSAAFLYNYLCKVIPGSESCLSFRIHDGKEHGIILESILGSEFKLVILPDASSNQYEEHKTLKDAGIDVLVLDHHEADHYSESAIVINNQLSDKYGNKNLSGVGVVYKFCKAIDSLLNEDIAETMLDLVALGLVADMMDMRSLETRHLVKKGIINIRNPFFKSLVEKQSYSLGASITPIGLAFYIAPLINATIRVGTEDEKRIMFKAFLENQSYMLIPSTKRGCKGENEVLVDQAVRNCVNIKNRQKRKRDEGVNQIEAMIEKNQLNSNKIILVNTSKVLDKNLSGLVANQLMAKYQKPVLLLRDSEDGTLQGSGRGYDKSDFNDFKGFLHESGFFNYAEGHPNAFGAGINKEDVNTFIEYANDKLSDYNFNSNYKVDFIFNAKELRPQDIIDIANMKPLWGKGIEESYVVIENIPVTNRNLYLLSRDKHPTLKITLDTTSLIKFGSTEEEYNSLYSEDGVVKINVVGKCSINEWQGNLSPQILIEEYNIVTQCDYYF
mgnify:CR=1 FL=1